MRLSEVAQAYNPGAQSLWRKPQATKKAAMSELKSHVAGLSIEIAEKVVREELSNKGKQLELVESMLGEATLN